jgi:hypothetical protein
VQEARHVLDSVYLPPAGHGDIYRATLRRPKPRVIALIDGSFRHRAAVRHKEILWALTQGIYVFGAASIGALRAAELTEFGMEGVGQIFADYRDGRLEDDDEVAVDHGPAELNHLPVNEAMVDIRATLAAAQRQGVIDAVWAERLLVAAKQTFYPQRSYKLLLSQSENMPPAMFAGFRDWLPQGKISQKKADALELLARVRNFITRDPVPFRATFRFERTEAWDSDVAFAAPLLGDIQDDVSRMELLDELRLDPEVARPFFDEALGMALARREAARLRLDLNAEEIEAFRRSWLERQGLRGHEAIADWCRDNGVDEASFGDFIAARAREAKLRVMAADLIEDCVADALRTRGKYAGLAARARKKQQALVEAGAEGLALGNSDHSAGELLAWFCRDRLRRPIAKDSELFARELSFPDAARLHRALLRERLYLQLTKIEKADSPSQ